MESSAPSELPARMGRVNTDELEEPGAELSSSHAYRRDVLTHLLRDITPSITLTDPEPLTTESIGCDPLSPDSLIAQTNRLLQLIQRTKESGDLVLLRSLRRELLITRWALVSARHEPSLGPTAPERPGITSRQGPNDLLGDGGPASEVRANALSPDGTTSFGALR